MSFNAYDFLKENPSVRDRMIKHDWRTLMMDDVPLSVKEELKNLTLKQNIPLTDANLFWNRQFIIATEFEGYKIKQPYFIPDVYKSKWPELVYLAVRNDDDTIRTGFRLLASLTNMKLTYVINQQIIINMVQEHYETAAAYDAYDDDAFDTIYLKAIGLDASWLNRRDNKVRKELICYCSLRLLQSLTTEHTYRNLIDLLADAGPPPEGTQYNSINAVERAHEARTAEMSARLMKQEGDTKFEYHPDLLEAIKEYDFFMPAAPAAMVLRGQQHNNCVATYKDKHTRPMKAEQHDIISRLFFTTSATLELDIETEFGVSVATRVVQFKGKYNRDVERTAKLTALRLKLTGKPIEWFRVTVTGR